jgi:hypothetical protein
MLSAREIELLRLRLQNQKLTSTTFKRPEDVVAWMGAVQAQEFAVARWGVGQRAAALTDARVRRAFDAGRILRTHILRPTWHFVAPKDIRWMLKLTSPRVSALNAYYYRRAGLDSRTLARSAKTIERALRDGRHVTRAELGDALERAGIPARGQQLAHIVMQAELDAVVCSGPLRGKHFTYALLDERVPPAAVPSNEDALAELTRRYFASHGPATLRDFTWWSGLRAVDARTGIALVKPALERTTVDGLTYYHAPSRGLQASKAPAVRLLPIYDEFVIAYQDSRQLVDGRARTAPADPFANFLVIDGRLAGTWRRHPTGESSDVRVAAFRPLPAAERRAIEAAVQRYSEFLRSALTVTIGSGPRRPDGR